LSVFTATANDAADEAETVIAGNDFDDEDGLRRRNGDLKEVSSHTAAMLLCLGAGGVYFTQGRASPDSGPIST
jgi:hypothetical protein